MTGKQPEVGELWTLRRDGAGAAALVVDKGPGYLLVWPVTTVTEKSVTLWPSIVTGVDPKWARRYALTILSVEDCQELYKHHRDTMALTADWSMEGKVVFAGTSPFKDVRNTIIETMTYLGED